jgi:hypothetical protein
MLYLSGISKPDLQYLAPINRHSSKHEDFKDHSQKTAIKVTNPAFTMPDSCLVLRILFTAFLLLFSLIPTQATTFSLENPPRNPSLLGGISTNTLPPAKCFDNSLSASQTPLHRLLRPTDCLSLISNLYIADGVLKTGGLNEGPSPNGNMIWEATSGTCQASVELHGQMRSQISGQVWLKVLRAFQILYTDCVKTGNFGGQISIHKLGSLEPSKKYVVKLRKRAMAHKHAAQERDVSINDSSFVHAKDSQNPIVVQVDRAEHTTLASKLAALKRVCSERPSGAYINQHTKALCHSFCNLAIGMCDGGTTGRYSNTPQQVAETTIDFDGTIQAGKIMATGLHVKPGKEKRAHSATNELSSVAIGRRDLDLLRSVGLEINGPQCYNSAFTVAKASGCREDTKRLRFDSTGPVESALWEPTISQYETYSVTKLDRIAPDHCSLSFKRYKMGSLHTLEDVIWKSTQRLLQKLSDKCLSSRFSSGEISLRDKSTGKITFLINLWVKSPEASGINSLTPLLASTHNPDGPTVDQVNSPGHTPASGRFAALKRFCSKDQLGGKMSERTKELCHSYCDFTTAACAVATVALYGTNHPHAAYTAAASGGIAQLGKSISTRLAIPKEESSHAHEIHGDNLVKRRRSSDSGRPHIPTKHSLPARFQKFRVPPTANLQMQISA